MRSVRGNGMVAVFVLLGLLVVGRVSFALTRPENAQQVSCDGPLPERTAWSSGGEAQTDEGYRLLACERLIGLTAAEVEELLGPADERHDNALGYYMGPDGLGMDEMLLVADLSDGRVASAAIGQG